MGGGRYIYQRVPHRAAQRRRLCSAIASHRVTSRRLPNEETTAVRNARVEGWRPITGSRQGSGYLDPVCQWAEFIRPSLPPPFSSKSSTLALAGVELERGRRHLKAKPLLSLAAPGLFTRAGCVVRSYITDRAAATGAVPPLTPESSPATTSHDDRRENRDNQRQSATISSYLHLLQLVFEYRHHDTDFMLGNPHNATVSHLQVGDNKFTLLYCYVYIHADGFVK